MGALDELGDQEVEVGVALAVAVGRHVDRHAACRDREVGAVVEVEAAQEVLVGLAAARVLGGDGAGHGLDQLAGAELGSTLEVLPAGRALVGRPGDAEQVVASMTDVDAVEELRLVGIRLVVGCAPAALRVALRVVVVGLLSPAQRTWRRTDTPTKNTS